MSGEVTWLLHAPEDLEWGKETCYTKQQKENKDCVAGSNTTPCDYDPVIQQLIYSDRYKLQFGQINTSFTVAHRSRPARQPYSHTIPQTGIQKPYDLTPKDNFVLSFHAAVQNLPPGGSRQNSPDTACSASWIIVLPFACVLWLQRVFRSLLSFLVIREQVINCFFFLG